MPDLHVLRVFVDDGGRHGNPLGVFLGAAAVPEARRQAVAADLGFSETVFVEDADTARVRIHTPTVELPFAGHPMVGTAWLLETVDVLRPPAGEVVTWTEGDVRWIRARPEWAPPIELVEFPTAADVEALSGAPGGGGAVDCWAWADEAAGEVRCRVFVPEVGIPEDEATGAAAVRLVASLGRAVTIRQGRGSVIHARPGPDGTSEVGGRVVLDEVRVHVV